MKKHFSRLTALFLSLTLALSLALPAWAAEDPIFSSPVILIQPVEGSSSYLSWDEFLQQYLADRPERYESFDADAWFEENYSDWITKEDFMEGWAVTDEAAFKEYMWEEYLDNLAYDEDSPLYQEIAAAYDTYLVETYEFRHPGELDKLKTEDLLAGYGYTKTLTPLEQFMEDQGITDPARVRPRLLRNYASSRLWVDQTRAASLAAQEQYPEQWASFDADRWYTDMHSYESKEEYMDRYSLSEEEFREIMFTYYVDSESWKWDLSLPGGGQPAELWVNGELVEGIVLADGVSYASADVLNPILGTQLTGDRIPIGQTAREAGWDVVWNPNRKQVLLYQKDSLPQSDFTQFDELMNRILSTVQIQEGQSYRTASTTTLKLTAFNSLDGDRTASARITTELLQKDALYEYTVTVNAGDLVSLMPRQLLEQIDAQLGAQSLGSLLRACKVTVLLNAETGDLYLNAPVLSLLDSDFTTGSWLHLSADQSPVLSLLANFGSLEWNTNDILYQALLNDSAGSYWGGQMPYLSYLQSQGMLGGLFGPQNFTRRGETISWSLDARSFQDLLPDDGETAIQLASILKEFEVKLSVDQRGKAVSDMVLRLDMDALAELISRESWDPSPLSAVMTAWFLNLLDFRLESHASSAGGNGSSTASFHWKNQFKLEISGASTRQSTSSAPRSAPPEGAEIMDLS